MDNVTQISDQARLLLEIESIIREHLRRQDRESINRYVARGDWYNTARCVRRLECGHSS